MPKKLIGKRILAVVAMPERLMKTFAWYDPGVMLVLDDGTSVVASRDPEGNGPGAIFGEAPPGALPPGMATGFHVFPGETPSIIGTKIRRVRALSKAEAEREGWAHGEGGIVLELDDGATLLAAQDPEGNGPGELIAIAKDGETWNVEPEGSKGWSPKP